MIMLHYAVNSFPLLNFLLHQAIGLNSLDQFLSFTDNFIVVSFEDVISKNTFDIMKLTLSRSQTRKCVTGFF